MVDLQANAEARRKQRLAEANAATSGSAVRVGNTGQRINSRQAEANAALQNQQRAQNLLDSGVQTIQGPEGEAAIARLQDIAEGNTTADTALMRNPDNAAQQEQRQAFNRQQAQETLGFNNNRTALDNLNAGIDYVSASGRSLNPFGGASSVAREQIGINGNREYVLTDGTRVSADSYDKQLNSLIPEVQNERRLELGLQQSKVAPVSPKEISGLSIFGDILKTNPELAPLASAYDNYLNSIDSGTLQQLKIAETTQGAAQQANAQTQALIQSFIDRQEQLKNQSDLLSKSLNENAKSFLEEQKQIQEDELEMQRAEQTRQISAQRTKSIDDTIGAFALAGGFGSSAGIRQVADVEQEAQEALTRLNTIAGIEKRKISSDFTAKWIQADQNYQQSMLESSRQFTNNVQQLETMAFSSSQALEKEIVNIGTQLMQSQAEAQKEKAQVKLSAIAKMTAQVQEAKKTELLQKQQAYSNLVEAFTTFTPDSSMRRYAIKEAKMAGLNVAGLSTGDVTLDYLQKMKSSVQEELYSPFQYNDPVSRQLMQSAQVVGNKLTGESARAQTHATVKQYLDRGDADGAREYLENIVYNTLTGTAKEAFSSRQTIIDATTPLLKSLKAIQGTDNEQDVASKISGYNVGMSDLNDQMAKRVKKADGYENLTLNDFNWLEKEKQNLRNKFGFDKDPELQDIFAKVENIASIVINQRYGAAVTDGEMARAREYIAISGNTLGDMINKLDNFSQFSQLQNDQIMGLSIGKSAYTQADDTVNQPMEEKDWDASFKDMDSYFKPGFQSSKNESFLDTLAQAHIQKEGYGTPNAVTITQGNNPGALKYHSSNARFGARPGKNNFAMFPDYESGYAALKEDLRAKITGNSRAAALAKSNNPSILDYISVYAPAGDNNNPSGYALFVVSQLNKAGYNVSVNTPLSELQKYV